MIVVKIMNTQIAVRIYFGRLFYLALFGRLARIMLFILLGVLIMDFSKEVRVRLKGNELKKLNNCIFERDQSTCVVCGKYVPNTNKFHHEPAGVKKSDEITKGVVLCFGCHQQRHFSANSKILKGKIQNYLQEHYETN